MRSKALAALVAILWAVPPALAQDATAVSLCQLLEDPSAYNHKLIKISGRISRGFEDFTLSDERCDTQQMVWLELGGTVGAEVVYCCNVSAGPDRPSPLVVEGIETTIVRDAQFDTFQVLTKRRGGATATVVGRYFAGTQQRLPGGTFWVGYGHLGMASLLVIQQVIAVDRR